MKNRNQILSIVWLVVTVLASFSAIHAFFTDDAMKGLQLLVVAIIAGFMYWLRRKGSKKS